MTRVYVIAAVVVILSGFPHSSAGASSAGGAPAASELIVRYETPLPQGKRRMLSLPRTELVRLPAGSDVDDAIAQLERRPDVLFAEPNVAVHSLTTPNDSYFPELWALSNPGQANTADADIHALEAWDVFTGNGLAKVAVIDSGVDYNHADLVGNVVPGYDFADDDTDPMDENMHGTHVSGTIGARGNNGIGVTGVNWNVQIVPVRVLDSWGTGTLASVVDGIVYAGQSGARVANLSFGYYGHSKALAAALAAAPNTLFVAAAGNDAYNNDKQGMEPCTAPAPNLVCVAATNKSDKLASFSNFGRRTVDLAAPGVNVLSTVPNNAYAFLSGTSMAAPHVAGIAALMLGVAPELTTLQLKTALLASIDKLPSLKAKSVTGGRVNADKALRQALKAARSPDSNRIFTPSKQPGA